MPTKEKQKFNPCGTFVLDRAGGRVGWGAHCKRTSPIAHGSLFGRVGL